MGEVKNNTLKAVTASVVLALFCLCAGTSHGASSPRDITRQVCNQTDFDEQVGQFCQDYCQGNERKGTIESVTIQDIGKNLHRVVVYISLQNRHDTGPPFNLTPFDWTVGVRAVGTLDAERCVLSVEDIIVENDLSDLLSNYASRYKGTRHQVRDCKSFLGKRGA